MRNIPPTIPDTPAASTMRDATLATAASRPIAVARTSSTREVWPDDGAPAWLPLQGLGATRLRVADRSYRRPSKEQGEGSVDSTVVNVAAASVTRTRPSGQRRAEAGVCDSRRHRLPAGRSAVPRTGVGGCRSGASSAAPLLNTSQGWTRVASAPRVVWHHEPVMETTSNESGAVAAAPVSERAPLAEGPGWRALSKRDDLAKYAAGNSIALFAAELRLGIDDIDTFAADALTDHGNDKKCDLVAVLRDTGQLVIAQTYAAKSPETRSGGPANKASDLNTAVSWLLAGEVSDLPDVLRDAAIEARDALQNGDISDLQIWSVHNCPESQNVETELAQVSKTAESLIARYFSGSSVSVTYTEMGRDAINELYRRTELPILVDNELTFDISGGFETAGDTWRAYNTAVRLSDLRDLWAKHGTDLLSPNIRDYLGVVKSERNINYGIKVTAKDTPKDFFIYNNGITAMVHSFEANEDATTVRVRGLGIVNGGQTTGSIGTLADGESRRLGQALVQIRFVTSSSADVLANVVRFNNTQNKVEATDFRSKDAVQDRLRGEFEQVPDALYRGARRGGAEDAIKRERSLLSDSAVAQSVASFHGYPNLAYNELRKIWENDLTYARFFNERLHARHIVFCYSLLKAVEDAKLKLNGIPEDRRTESQKRHAEFFRSRGGVHLLTAAIGGSIETFLGEAVPDRFSVRFKENVSPAAAVSLWRPVVQGGLPFTSQLSGATNLGLKSAEKVAEALRLFEAMIEATRDSKQEMFDSFAGSVEHTSPLTP